MDYIVTLFQESTISASLYFLMITFIVTFVLISFGFIYDYNNKKIHIRKIESFERSLKDLVEEFRSFELLFTEQKKTLEEHKYSFNRIEQEISRLADSLNSDSNITTAINLAKEGLNVEEISKRTGIPIEEVEPIVKFHGNHNF